MAFSNPFKKKENNEFTLDNESLPNLSGNLNSEFPSDFNSGNNFQEPDLASSPMSLPPLPNDLSSNNNSNNFDSKSFNSSFDNPNSQNLSSSFSNSNLTSSFTNQPSSFDSNSFSNSNLEPSMQSNYHSSLNNAQMETTLAKITLLDAKMSAIEQKLDIITKILLEETSEETKRKLKVKQMMDTIKSVG